jgi:hypothetical protein
LTASAKASLLTYRSEYTFDGVEYSPLIYKVIMHLATIDSVATTRTLRDNLQNLGVFAVTVKGIINKVNMKFDTNYSQLLARGATLNDPIGILFEAYLLVLWATTSQSTLAPSTMTTSTGTSPVSLTRPWHACIIH